MRFWTTFGQTRGQTDRRRSRPNVRLGLGISQNWSSRWLLLRRALGSPAFESLHVVRRCQILTNLANQLDTAGRFVESRQLWGRALSLQPVFWMARANRARGLMHYAHALYRSRQRRRSHPACSISCRPVFRETRPFGSLEAAAIEARRRNCLILAFVYDPTQPERGKLRWALDYFLKNRRTRDTMNGSFVTALLPLAAIVAISDILTQQSMERSRWVVLDQQLRPLDQRVIHANPQEAERIVDQP